MNNTINSDLIRGNIDTIILRALCGGDRYGYDIIGEIEQRSSGKYKLKQPTLYSCLNRLENQGFIRSYWGTKSIGGRRKYYTLTEMGKEIFIKNKTDWEYSKTLIDNLITDNEEYELQAVEADNTNTNDFNAENEIENEEPVCEETVEFDSENEEEITCEEDDESAYGEDVECVENEDTFENEEEIALEDKNEIAAFDDEELSESEEETALEKDVSEFLERETENIPYQETANNFYQETLETEREEVAAIDLSALVIDERENARVLENLLYNSEFNNYTKKLEKEDYIPDKNIFTEDYLRVDNYFKDIEYCEDEDEKDFEDEEDFEEQTEPSKPSLATFDTRDTRQIPQNNVSKTYDCESNTFDAYHSQTQAYENSEAPQQLFPASYQMSPPKESVQKRASDSFISYNASRANSQSQAERVENPASKDIIKLFEEKLAGIKKPEPPVEEKSSKKDILKIFEEKTAAFKKPKTEEAPIVPINEVPIATKDNPEFYRKEQIQIRNFKRLQESTASLGDDIKIRTYDDNSARRFNEQYYFYSNRLKLRQYFILFCIVLTAVVLAYIAINLGLRKSIYVASGDLTIYIACVIGGLCFPTAAFILNWNNPNKRKRVTQSFRTQLLFSIFIAIDLILVLYFGNVFFGMPLNIGSDYYTRLLVPCIMCLIIPINSIIYQILIRSKKYSV